MRELSDELSFFLCLLEHVPRHGEGAESARAIKLAFCSTGEICQWQEVIRRGDGPSKVGVAVQLGHVGAFVANELCCLLVKARLVVPTHGGKIVHYVA